MNFPAKFPTTRWSATETQEAAIDARPAYIARARLYERRLKAAVHRANGRADLKALYLKLRRARQRDERAIVQGPYPHLAGLAYFLGDYGAAIEQGCKAVARPRLPNLPGIRCIEGRG